MIAVIAAAVAAVVFSLGSLVHDTFQQQSDCFSSQLDSTSC